MQRETGIIITRRRPASLLALTFSAALMLTGGITVYADTSAMEMTQQFVNQALQIMANKQLPVANRTSQLRAVLEPHFDFREMARQSLGPHWRELTEAQRQEFSNVFKNFIESAYLSKINDYSGQQVQFLRQTSLGAGFVQVHSTIVQAGKAPIPINYLLDQKDGSWKIYDVTVDNISIIQNYRNQFNRVINDSGFDKLLADLKAKQQQLALPQAS